MEYKGYEIIEISPGAILVKNANDFEPKHIFECGQCFRWRRQEDGSYTGVAMGRVINVKRIDDTGSRSMSLLIRNTSPQDFINIWHDYFDLGRDYGEIKRRIACDEIMARAVSFGAGIRLLKQDLWETAVSFIFSTNKKIPMISEIIESVSRMYGTPVLFGGRTYYTFPDAETLADADLESMAECRGGYRCGYVSGTARLIVHAAEAMATYAPKDATAKVSGSVQPTVPTPASTPASMPVSSQLLSPALSPASSPVPATVSPPAAMRAPNLSSILPVPSLLSVLPFNREQLACSDLGEARKALMELPGVGPKVADCILLFSGTRYDVFPIDVWVKRVMSTLYFNREARFKEIQDFAAARFGTDSGFAQQYLFYYAREHGIGK